MKLLTKDIEKKQVTQHKKHVANQGRDYRPYCKSESVVVKYFTPDANATWWILEGTPIESHPNCSKVLILDNDGRTIPDWYLYGLCDLGLGFREFGDVLLSDLLSVKGKLGLPVERDKHYSGTYNDLLAMAKVY